MTRRAVFAAVLAFALSGVGASAAERIPLEAFFASPPLEALQLSPDGRHAAGISRGGKSQRAVVIDLATRAQRVVTEFSDRPIYAVWWGNDERLIVSYAVDHGRAPRFLLVDRDGRNLRERACEDLIAGPPPEARRDERRALRLRGRLQFGGRPLGWLPNHPDHVLISLYGVQTQAYAASEVHRLDLARCTARIVIGSRERAIQWFADSHGTVRAGYGLVRTSGRLLYRASEGSAWRDLRSLGERAIELRSFVPIGFAPGERELFALSRIASDRFELVRVDPESARLSEPLISDPKLDVEAGVLRARDGRAVAVFHGLDDARALWLDPALAQQSARIASAAGIAEVHPSSLDRSETRMLFARHFSTRPSQVFFASETREGELRVETLVADPRELAGRELPEPQLVHYIARDGLDVPAYLTLPRGPGPHPAIVLVNDAPLLRASGARASRAYDPERQFLVDRGYAVLQPNPRGTPGYGLRFEMRGDREWGRAVQDDLDDGARWLVAQGHADPNRICIAGTGFGGYAALWGATRSPELYRCAASLGGIADLARFESEHARYVYDEHLRAVLGEDLARLHEVSPQDHIARLRVPVLLAHGEYDALVHPDLSRTYAAALARAGKAHELLILDEEGHGTPDWEAERLRFYAALERFFDAHLRPGLPAEPRAARPVK